MRVHSLALLLGLGGGGAGILGEPCEEGHEPIGLPLRGLQAAAHPHQLLPDGRLLLPQPPYLLQPLVENWPSVAGRNDL